MRTPIGPAATNGPGDIPWAALAPLLGAILVLDVACLVSCWRGPQPKVMPRWAWTLVILFVSTPLGALAYLLLGRPPRRDAAATTREVGPARPPEGREPSGVRRVRPDGAMTGPRTELIAPATPRTGAPPAVTARHLVRDFGGAGILDVSFDIPDRGVFAVIGPNGAGKTTLFTLLTGLDRPDSGELTVAGARAGSDGRALVAYCPDTPEFEPWLTATEVLRQSRGLLGLPPRDPAPDLRRLGLAGAAGRRVGAFSRGMTQRLAIAATLATQAPVLLFDEPTSALDPLGRAEVLDLMGELGRDHAIVLSSHSLAEVERIADRVLVLDRGRVVAEGALATLLRDHLDPSWIVRTDGPASVAAQELGRCAWAGPRPTIEVSGSDRLRLTFASVPEGTHALAGFLWAAAVPIISAEPESGDLDGAFTRLVHAARLTTTAPEATHAR